MVRQFVDEQVIPIAEEYGGMGLDLTTYAMIVEELSRGWISISGIVNTHFIGSYLLMKFGTDDQKDRFLPRMASGEIRAAFSLSEPGLGSDVQAISTRAKQDGDDWVINGQKMWVTNGLLSGVVFLLAKTDPDADPPYKGMTCFITEKEPSARSSWPCATRRSARRSAGRSRSTRRSSSSSPTWRRRSRPRAC